MDRLETQEAPKFSFQDLPIGSKFRGPDGGMYWKVGENQILLIRMSLDGGEIGKVFDWNPEWNARTKFCILTDTEVEKLIEANTVDLHQEQSPRELIEDICGLLRDGRNALVARMRGLFQR